MKTKSLTRATLFSIFVMSVITAITMNSCQKEILNPKLVKATPTSSSAPSSKGTAIVGLNLDIAGNAILNEVNNAVLSTHKTAKGFGRLAPNGFDSSSCAIITFDSSSKPYLMHYDYGTGCVGSDGKTRSGMVTLTYDDGDIRTVNNVMTITYQNYGLNGNLINGFVSMSNTGINGNGNPVITQVGNYYAVRSNNQGGSETDTMNINMAYEWLAGEFSSPAANWQFSITGSVAATSSLGGSAGLTVTSPLIKNCHNSTCNFIIQGMEHSYNGSNTQDIDFGNPGGCSGQESVTSNGVTKVVHQ